MKIKHDMLNYQSTINEQIELITKWAERMKKAYPRWEKERKLNTSEAHKELQIFKDAIQTLKLAKQNRLSEIPLFATE